MSQGKRARRGWGDCGAVGPGIAGCGGGTLTRGGLSGFPCDVAQNGMNMMMRMMTRAALVIAGLAMATPFLGGCSSGGEHSSSGASRSYEERKQDRTYEERKTAREQEASYRPYEERKQDRTYEERKDAREQESRPYEERKQDRTYEERKNARQSE